MKMRQYIAITDHNLWDIITNGDQATIEPASSSGQPSAPKTSIVVNVRRNNEKALNILLSAIPDRHLLSFHDAQDARSLWAAIKARFGGNKESKKMQKNLLKKQFETFVVGPREELDSAYDRFQNIISMLELYDAKEFDDDPVTFAMVALNGIEEVDWSIEIDADHVDLRQDGLGVFYWSEEADNAPVALALMATSSTDSSGSE
ncbi:hypothetical protein Tco_0238690, partial [Tanacetum coccineum]